jgi:hypothetical protein
MTHDALLHFDPANYGFRVLKSTEREIVFKNDRECSISIIIENECYNYTFANSIGREIGYQSMSAITKKDAELFLTSMNMLKSINTKDSRRRFFFSKSVTDAPLSNTQGLNSSFDNEAEQWAFEMYMDEVVDHLAKLGGLTLLDTPGFPYADRFNEDVPAHEAAREAIERLATSLPDPLPRTHPEVPAHPNAEPISFTSMPPDPSWPWPGGPNVRHEPDE